MYLAGRRKRFFALTRSMQAGCPTLQSKSAPILEIKLIYIVLVKNKWFAETDLIARDLDLF